MNPLCVLWLGALIRWVLALLAGFLIRGFILSPVGATAYVLASTLASAALVWSFWQKHTMLTHRRN